MTANDRYTRPLARSAALLLIDVQRDFLDTPGDDAAMPVDGTRAAIPAMAKLATAFRERGLPIVHVVRLYQPDGSNVDLVRRRSIEQGARIAVPGSTGSQIAVERPGILQRPAHEFACRGHLVGLDPQFECHRDRHSRQHNGGRACACEENGISTFRKAVIRFSEQYSGRWTDDRWRIARCRKLLPPISQPGPTTARS